MSVGDGGGGGGGSGGGGSGGGGGGDVIEAWRISIGLLKGGQAAEGSPSF